MHRKILWHRYAFIWLVCNLHIYQNTRKIYPERLSSFWFITLTLNTYDIDVTKSLRKEITLKSRYFVTNMVCWIRWQVTGISMFIYMLRNISFISLVWKHEHTFIHSQMSSLCVTVAAWSICATLWTKTFRSDLPNENLHKQNKN